MRCYTKLLLPIVLAFVSTLAAAQGHYKNFKVSVYCRAQEVAKMKDTTGYLLPIWTELSRQLKVDKVYLETHRDLQVVDQQTITIAKKFFTDRGIQLAGGITYTVSEPNRFETYCYSNPDHRKKVQQIAEFTAKNFDEFILDDFFFTNCKDDGAIKEKGSRSWTQYRLQLMNEAGKTLVVGPAKKVNPNVKVIIKYPNWYEHFQGLGFNLEKEPAYFDGIYTGTETRDAILNNQHLQPYLGYNIMRYFENIAPGRNGGGWVDPGGMGSYDRYAEQLWITLFAKAKEVTLFDLRQLVRKTIPTDRSAWQGQQTSFDFDAMMAPVNHNGGTPDTPTTIARAAGYAFETVDKYLGVLGQPIGVKSYRPYHSVGEDFLQNFLGQAGIPMDQRPQYPATDSVILLTEEAKFDTTIVAKMKRSLTEGKTVVITAGLLKALQGKGIEDIAEIRYSDKKALVKDFNTGDRRLISIPEPVIIPQIQYLTNDAWEVVSGIDGPNGWPMLLEADYSKGRLYVLAVPENFADLFTLPAEALNRIREVLGGGMKMHLEGPGNISLYAYDNKTFIVESFLPQTTEVRMVLPSTVKTITDVATNETFSATIRRPRGGYVERDRKDKAVFTFPVKPHSFRVFRYE